MFFVRWRSSVGVVNPKEKKERKESAERWLFVGRFLSLAFVGSRARQGWERKDNIRTPVSGLSGVFVPVAVM